MIPSKNLNWAKHSSPTETLDTLYDNWAVQYDSDMDKIFNYAVPQYMVTHLIKYVDNCTHILDAGVGTGLVGEALCQHGFNHLVGLDISEGMLQIAKDKNIYNELLLATLGKPLQLDSNSFDAVVAVGVFGTTHAPAKSCDELIRITKSGGIIAFTLRQNEYSEDNEFGKKFAELENTKQWKLLECSEPFQGLPKSKPELLFLAWIYQVI